MMLKKSYISLLVISWILVLQQVHALPGSRESGSLHRKISHHRILLSNETEQYAVIFDAGSTGSRVHVFRFSQDLNLLKIGDDFEYYQSVKPGLSSYESDPKAAAESIKPLLVKAEATVPTKLQPETPIKVGATAGLRLLSGNAPEEILEAVRTLIKNESSFKYKAEWVTVLDGSDEAAYLWVALNYLLGTAGKIYPETVATIDLGGGSMQMTYAVSDEIAAKNITNEGESYVKSKTLVGKKYNLYAYSYLNYGLLATRAGILNLTKNSSNPCVTTGYHGNYTYNSVFYKASSPPSGANLKSCRAYVLKYLNLDAPCKHKNCTFNGIWNGGGGAGMKKLYVASFFYDIANEVGIVPYGTPSAVVRPADFLRVAKRACATKYENMTSTFPHIEYSTDIPFVCMDLVYEYTMLVNGLGLHPLKHITLVTSVSYNGSLIGAAWPLGSALDAISTS